MAIIAIWIEAHFKGDSEDMAQTLTLTLAFQKHFRMSH